MTKTYKQLWTSIQKIYNTKFHSVYKKTYISHTTVFGDVIFASVMNFIYVHPK